MKQNGHEWNIEDYPKGLKPAVKCENCRITYGRYLGIRQTLKRNPDRKDLAEKLKCPPTKETEEPEAPKDIKKMRQDIKDITAE